MSESLEKKVKPSAQVIEVLELEDALLDLAAGGKSSINIDCDTTNSGCNTVAGCGGGK